MGLHYYIEPVVPPTPPTPVVFAIDASVLGNILANSAEVLWSTNKFATGVFKYGLSPGALTNVVYFRDMAKVFDYKMLALTIETAYYYEIDATAFTGETATIVGTFSTNSSIIKENDDFAITIATETLDRQIFNFIVEPHSTPETLLTVDPDGENEAGTPSVATATKTKVEKSLVVESSANVEEVFTALEIGVSYTIALYVSNDDFTNVGGTNVTGNVFTATGTTPTHWTHGSCLFKTNG